MNKKEISMIETMKDMNSKEVMSALGKATIAVVPPIAFLNSLADSVLLKNIFDNQKRFIEEINTEISTLKRRDIEQVTAAHLQLVNGVFIAASETFENQKLPFLKKCVMNGLSQRDLLHSEAMAISRVLRDITAEELIYILENQDGAPFKDSLSQEEKEKYLKQVFSMLPRLVSLGLANASHGTFAESQQGYFTLSDLAEKLIKLISAR